jgi:hypothetical protein
MTSNFEASCYTCMDVGSYISQKSKLKMDHVINEVNRCNETTLDSHNLCCLGDSIIPVPDTGTGMRYVILKKTNVYVWA